MLSAYSAGDRGAGKRRRSWLGASQLSGVEFKRGKKDAGPRVSGHSVRPLKGFFETAKGLLHRLKNPDTLRSIMAKSTA